MTSVCSVGNNLHNALRDATWGAIVTFMSTSTEGLPIPTWDLADRLGKALRTAGISVQEMADYLDVHRNTVSAWLNGRVQPTTQTQRLWALRTGIPFEWIKDGVDEPKRPGGGPGGGLPTPDDRDGLGGGSPNQRVADVHWLLPAENDELRPTG